MRDFVKYKWLSLTSVEQRWAIVGATLLFCFLLYLVIWAKFTHNLRVMQDEIATSQDLLHWMRENTPQLQRLRKAQLHKAFVDPSSFYSSVLQSLKESTLSTLATAIVKVAEDKVQIEFDSVSFDNLINWLTNLWEKNSIRVDQLVIKKTHTPGDVQVNVILGV